MLGKPQKYNVYTILIADAMSCDWDIHYSKLIWLFTKAESVCDTCYKQKMINTHSIPAIQDNTGLSYQKG